MFKKTGAAIAGSISRLARRERMCFFVMALGGMSLGMTEPLSAETLLSGLARAYAGNPDLNQRRAAIRVRDEDMPKALAGMRPRVNIQASAGPLYGNLRLPFGRNAMTGQRQVLQEEYTGYPRSATLNMSQSIFDAGRTTNSVKQAESNVFAARAAMRLTEQATLQNGATAYMNVLRDARGRKSAQEQHRRVGAAAQADPGPFSSRRGDAHRRGASGGLGRSGAVGALRRAGAAEKQHRQLPSDYWGRAHAFGAGALARNPFCHAHSSKRSRLRSSNIRASSRRCIRRMLRSPRRMSPRARWRPLCQ